jgi:hypothetical protein
VGPRVGLEDFRKSQPPPPGIDPRTIQPVASRYTDCAFHTSISYVMTKFVLHTLKCVYIFLRHSVFEIQKKKIQNIKIYINLLIPPFFEPSDCSAVALIRVSSQCQDMTLSVLVKEKCLYFVPFRCEF